MGMMRLRTRKVDYFCTSCACTKELRSRGVTFCYWGNQKRRKSSSENKEQHCSRMEACPGLANELASGNWTLPPWERDGNHLSGGHDHLPGGGGTWCSRRSGLPALCRGGRVQWSAGLFLRASAGDMGGGRTGSDKVS